MTIGIDFGTTKTIVSWVNPRTGRAETIGCFSHSAQTSTQVFVGEDGECVYGERARIEGVIDPMGLWEKFKLKLGSNDLLVNRGSGRNGGQGMDAVDLAAKFLEYVKSTCESADEFRGCVIDSAVITVPVVFTFAQRSDLEKAAALAGFNKVTIRLEPEAAAVAYMRESLSQWNRALIIDWGGGTLDTALIEKDMHGNFFCNRTYSRGRDDVGGEEIDRKFVNYVIERFRERGATIPDPDSVDDDGSRDSAERRASLATEYYRIRNGILEDKKNLDSHTSFSFYPKGGYGNSPRHSVSITQDDFRNQARNELDAACELLKELMNDIPAEEKPERVFLAGGTCWSDVVRDALQEASGLEVIRGLRAREMVALGAAYFIDDSNNYSSEKKEDERGLGERDRSSQMSATSSMNSASHSESPQAGTKKSESTHLDEVEAVADAHKNIMLKEVCEAFSGVELPGHLHIGNSIPANKRLNARKGMKVKESDSEMLLLYDSCAFWSPGDTGLCVVPSGAYLRSDWEDPKFYRWSQITKVSRVDDSYLRINDVEFFVFEGIDKLASAIRTLVQKAKGGKGRERHTSRPFRLVVEEVTECRLGLVVTGVVEGGNIEIGQRVNVLRRESYYDTAVVIGIEREGSTVECGHVGDCVSLLLDSKKMRQSDLAYGLVLRGMKPDEAQNTESTGALQNGNGNTPTSRVSTLARTDSFHFVVDSSEKVGDGFGVIGVIEGTGIHAGRVVDILCGGRCYCTAEVFAIIKDGKTFDVGYVGDNVGLILRSRKLKGLSRLKPGAELRLSKANKVDPNGRIVPCTRKKSEYPHVLIKDGDGALVPEPGYAWINSSSAKDFGVMWKPGFLHPNISHIVASEVEGEWIPEDGYVWDGRWSVRKK